MRILHVLDHSVPLQSGYTFRTLGILRGQRARGWETAHLTTPRHRRPGPDPETAEGLEFHRTPAPASPLARLPVARERLEMAATERRLHALARRLAPDLLHAHSPVLSAVPALAVGRRLGIPVVYEVRAFWEDAAVSEGMTRAGSPRYHATRWLETRALRRADAVTCICEGLRGDIVARGIGADKVTVIPNAVDVSRFNAASAKDPDLVARLRLEGAVVLGFIGSFYRYEGIDLLVRAAADLIKSRGEVRLLLVGGGPEAERVGRLIAELGAGDRVIATGRVPHEEVGKYYDLVDVFVYPRLPMRLTDLVTPLKPLESMAMRKVVLASDVGGHKELIRDRETGFLFRAGDPGALEAVIEEALAQRGRWPEIGHAGRRFVETERSWPAVVARYEGVYERALAGRDRRAAPARQAAAAGKSDAV
jgi:PEP-CTERM/exosortase A-associated glycosyltransferase